MWAFLWSILREGSINAIMCAILCAIMWAILLAIMWAIMWVVEASLNKDAAVEVDEDADKHRIDAKSVMDEDAEVSLAETSFETTEVATSEGESPGSTSSEAEDLDFEPEAAEERPILAMDPASLNIAQKKAFFEEMAACRQARRSVGLGPTERAAAPGTGNGHRGGSSGLECFWIGEAYSQAEDNCDGEDSIYDADWTVTRDRAASSQCETPSDSSADPTCSLQSLAGINSVTYGDEVGHPQIPASDSWADPTCSLHSLAGISSVTYGDLLPFPRYIRSLAFPDLVSEGEGLSAGDAVEADGAANEDEKGHTQSIARSHADDWNREEKWSPKGGDGAGLSSGFAKLARSVVPHSQTRGPYQVPHCCLPLLWLCRLRTATLVAKPTSQTRSFEHAPDTAGVRS